MVGLLPLCAVTVFEGELMRKYPEVARALLAIPRGAPGARRRFIHDPVEARPCGPPARLGARRDEGSGACSRRCSTRTSS